jgi:tRNA(Arg) A34 adenosine deaminase TadA
MGMKLPSNSIKPVIPCCDDEFYMKQALKVAEAALEMGEVPVGCVIVLCNHPAIAKAQQQRADDSKSDHDGQDSCVIISHGANQVNATRDATRHAEIVAINRLLTDGASSDQLRLSLDVLAKTNSQSAIKLPATVQKAR